MATLYSSNTRERKNFGSHVVFQDSKARILHSIEKDGENSEDAKQWVKKRYSTIEIDCTPQYATHTADTGNFVQKPGGVCFADGAWPKKIKGGEITERQRYLQRLTAEPTYFSGVPNMCVAAAKTVAQNNTINLYEQYFEKKEEIFEREDATMSLKTLCVLKDPCKIKRNATAADWHPDGQGRIMISYATMKFQKMDENTPAQSYIWDINKPNEPEYEFIPPSPLTCLRFNPRTHDHVAGGMYNGAIGFWDVKKKKNGRPVTVSPIECSHHDPVFDLSFISSRAGSECVSVSTDGQMLWWDVKQLEKPIDNFKLVTKDKEVMGISSLAYSSEGGPTKYLVGTEKGVPVLVDRKAKKDQPSEKKIKCIFSKGHGGHYRGVAAIKRNPVHTSYFLTVGDWCTKLWAEENLKSPIIISAHSETYLTSACWSTVRPSVYFTGKADGTMDIWDMYSKLGESIFTVKVSESAITTIKCSQDGKMLAVCCEDGSTSILQLGPGLSTMQRMEKEVVLEIFEREKKREALLDRIRMVKAKKAKHELKQKAAGGTKATNDAKKEEAAKEMSIKKADTHWTSMMATIEKEEKEAAEAAAKSGGQK